MADEVTSRRLSDLLIDPREALDVEIKGWLDLAGNNEHKAVLAKALLAIANHGGGFILIGLTETEAGVVPAAGRPPALDAFSQDQVNGIVHSYADPPFHCAVHLVPAPAGGVYPVIVVPGGHRAPIRARRAGPGNENIQQNAIYIRRPGPRSEIPQSARDWDDLLTRCLAARRDELLDRVRDLILGVQPQVAGPPPAGRLELWIDECLARWRHLIAALPADDPRRCPLGHAYFAYEMRGDIARLGPPEFLDCLNRSTVRHTGWPPFWVPSRAGIEPYMHEGSVECWLGREKGENDAAHSDFWRISPGGLAFLLRGYQEDGIEVTERGRFQPGEVFDVTLPVWRVGEVLLHAERLATNIGAGSGSVALRAQYSGLNGRQLASVSANRDVWGGRVSHQDAILLNTTVEVNAISPNLAEIVHPFLAPLYALFGFFDLPPTLVSEELARLRSHRF